VKPAIQNLKDRLSTNEDPYNVVLHSSFTGWENYIARNLVTRPCLGGKNYRKGKDKELLALCQEHATRYKKDTPNDNVLMFVHPFYLHLSHINELDTEEQEKEVKDYLDRLFFLLELNNHQHQADVVVLETAHHYTAGTSFLVEAGLVDNVIFTLYDQGIALKPHELYQFREKAIYLGGGYNERCLSDAVAEMKAKMASLNHLFAIEGLVLNSPQDFKARLLPKKVKKLEQSKMVTLDDVIERLGLGTSLPARECA